MAERRIEFILRADTEKFEAGMAEAAAHVHAFELSLSPARRWWVSYPKEGK